MEVFKNLLERIRGFFKKGDKKKRMENYLIIAVAGIILIIAAGPLFRGSTKQSEEEKREVSINEDSLVRPSVVSINEERIEAILSEIKGVGKVDVLVSYYTGSEIVPACDNSSSSSDTIEKDSSGGTRSINQSESEEKLVFEGGSSSVGTPVILKEIAPQVKGVIVVAEGAGNARIKEMLMKAVEVLLDVPVYRIQIYEKEKKK